jgi:hypothetical protein
MNYKLKIALAAVASMASVSAAYAGWDYFSTTNRVMVSGAACRATDGNAEYDVYHYSGSTSVGSWVTSPVRLYCPVNRRNLHAYSRSMSGSAEDLLVHRVWVKVNSPSGNVQCRLFGKDRSSGNFGNFIYSPWYPPMQPGLGEYVFFEWGTAWKTLNWGVMCDVPKGEAILNIEIHTKNNNFPA